MNNTPSNTQRPSGIPRASRLPVLSNRSSQIFVNPTLDVTNGENGFITPAPTSRLSKRSSIASIPRPLKASSTERSTPSVQPVASGDSKTRPAARTSSIRSTYSNTSSFRGPQDEETTDQLSSLSSFRTSSRQSSYGDAEALPSLTASKVRKSRPSLSDRAVESIQAVPTTPKDRRQSSFFNTADSPIMAPPPRPSSVMSNSSGTICRPGTSDGSFAKPAVPPPSAVKAPLSAGPATRTNGMTSQIGRGGTSLTRKLQSVRAAPQQKQAAAAAAAAAAPGIQDASQSASTTKTTAVHVPSSSSASSSALRQQIAAAKAAVKRERDIGLHDSTKQVDDHANAGAEYHDNHFDPFNQAPKDGKHILRNRIRSARLDGKLNIAALDLKDIPEEVMAMYSSASIEESKLSWAEVVDLTRLIAADNELETIADVVFPDLSIEELQQEENESAGQFGGIEMLDLHNNILRALPLGLRRLERLTVLNLTHNKLDNSALDTIAQVRTLRELRLGHNNLSGTVSGALFTLSTLEVLDLQANRLLALPEAIQKLTSLRVLNASNNQLTSLPMDALAQLSLQDLDASSNALIASLFPLGGISIHRTLRNLKLSNNSLAALTFSPQLELPELQTLDVTNNHLAILPSVAAWRQLSVLYAGDNKLAELPDGFTQLQHLRIANLSGNELHVLPSGIAFMDSLSTLILASNPLRHKKYLTMSAADIKQDLRATVTQGPDDYDDEVASWGTAPEDPTCVSSGWSVKAGGVLDLSNKGLTDSINDTLASFLQANEVRQLKLHGNKLSVIPPALWLGHDLRSLDLSGNPLDVDYLSEELELPSLVELSFSNCRVTSLEPLLQYLQAPELHILQINGNRIPGSVPDLHQMYPSLITLLASDNKFETVSADALRGYSTVDLTSNELQSLPAEIGLLWEEGLKSLEVGRNAFRVPGHRVLEKGTQATMRWLRDRIKSSDDTGANDID